MKLGISKLESTDAVLYATDFKVLSDLRKELVIIRNDYSKKKDYEKTRQTQIEIDILCFNVNEENLGYTYAGNTKDGQPYTYPNVDNFEEKDLAYIEKRLSNTNNTFLKSLYAHVLWNSSLKHMKFAEIAANSYFELVSILTNNRKKKDSDEFIFAINKFLKSSVLLASKLKNKSLSEKIRNSILSRVKDFSNQKLLYSNIELLTFILDHPKVFKKDSYKGIQDDLFNACKTKEDLYKIDCLEIIKRIEEKQNLNNAKWDNEIGKCYENLSYLREDNQNLVSTHFADLSFRHYSKAKNEPKAKELSRRYAHLKENMRLGKFQTEVDLSKIFPEADKFSETLSNKDSTEILYTLMYSKDILPSYDHLKTQFETNRKGQIQSILNATLLDQNGHVAEHIQSEEEHIKADILRNYNFLMIMPRRILIETSISACILKNKLTPNVFYNFIKTQSWLGLNLERSTNTEEPEKYNWLHLIMPAINDYFLQLEFYFSNDINQLNFILCIDSLCLKVEGILRDLLDLHGGQTFIHTTDTQNRPVVREKDLNALLREELFSTIFDKDDLFFLKFLLIEKGGFNLRNKIAHTLIRNSNYYSLTIINLLFICILRLAKNEYFPKKNTVANIG